LEAFQGQSHRTGHRHSFHFSAIGNEPGAKGFPSEGEVFVENPYWGSIILAIPSHRHRHSFHFSAIGNEPGAKGLPSEGEVFVENPYWGSIILAIPSHRSTAFFPFFRHWK